ncbi:hypothetical protein Tco_0273441 [Tanacetum coccineum]
MLHKPDGFIDPDHPDKSLPSKEALYGLVTSSRSWYDELSKIPDFPKVLRQGFRSTNPTRCRSCRVALDIAKKASGGIQFLGDKLVSWMSRSRTFTRLWLQLQQNTVVVLVLVSYSNSLQPVQKSRTKHIITRTFLSRFQLSRQANWYEMFESAETGRSYALSWKSCQGDSLNLPNHGTNIYTVKGPTEPEHGDGDAYSVKSDSLPHCSCSIYKDILYAFKVLGRV